MQGRGMPRPRLFGNANLTGKPEILCHDVIISPPCAHGLNLRGRAGERALCFCAAGARLPCRTLFVFAFGENSTLFLIFYLLSFI